MPHGPPAAKRHSKNLDAVQLVACLNKLIVCIEGDPAVGLYSCTGYSKQPRLAVQQFVMAALVCRGRASIPIHSILPAAERITYAPASRICRDLRPRETPAFKLLSYRSDMSDPLLIIRNSVTELPILPYCRAAWHVDVTTNSWPVSVHQLCSTSARSPGPYSTSHRIYATLGRGLTKQFRRRTSRVEVTGLQTGTEGDSRTP